MPWWRRRWRNRWRSRPVTPGTSRASRARWTAPAVRNSCRCRKVSTSRGSRASPTRCGRNWSRCVPLPSARPRASPASRRPPSRCCRCISRSTAFAARHSHAIMNPVQHLLASLDFLDWWLLGVVLALADVFRPKLRLLGLAIAAGIIGFALLLFPQIGWPWQLAWFAVLAAGALDAYRFLRRGPGRPDTGSASMSNFHDFSIKTIDGKPRSLKDYQGKPVLVVNVASQC